MCKVGCNIVLCGIMFQLEIVIMYLDLKVTKGGGVCILSIIFVITRVF